MKSHLPHPVFVDPSLKRTSLSDSERIQYVHLKMRKSEKKKDAISMTTISWQKRLTPGATLNTL